MFPGFYSSTFACSRFSPKIQFMVGIEKKVFEI